MNFDEVWERLCKATGWRKMGEMADFLSIKSPSVSGAKSRGTFPIEWAFKIGQEFGLSTDWILTGKEVGGQQSSFNTDLLLTVLEAFEAAQKMHWYNPKLMPPKNQTALIYTLYVLFSDQRLKHLVSKEFITGQAGLTYLLITNPGDIFKNPENIKETLDQVRLTDELNLFERTVEILSEFMAA
ncbi:MAG: hypothetical protein CVU66_00585 [Deltaproteobacteria bacterium HGW-Deltaproteobacteria-23]|nr:MAG: hypothetical protein CVU66_00585 [Deltaproteobacteria bacterium HGW-Deltaproteobacteria-23]